MDESAEEGEDGSVACWALLAFDDGAESFGVFFEALVSLAFLVIFFSSGLKSAW